MSSPKAAAKPASKSAGKSAGKPVRRTATARPVAKRITKPVAEPASRAAVAAADQTSDASSQAQALAAEIERAIQDGRLDGLTPDAFQALMAALCRLYSARSEAGVNELPLQQRGGGLANTDVMIMASALLRSANLAVFELGMWQSWTGR